MANAAVTEYAADFRDFDAGASEGELAAADIQPDYVLDKLDGVAKDAKRAELHWATASGH